MTTKLITLNCGHQERVNLPDLTVGASSIPVDVAPAPPWGVGHLTGIRMFNPSIGV